jgi:hypothetical protein
MSKPLFVTPDGTSDPPSRYVVKDEEGNVLFMTELGDPEPGKTATMWAMGRGGWLRGLVKGGSVTQDTGAGTDSYLMVYIGRPLHVVPDRTHDPPRRLMVVDEDGNVLYLTDLGEDETEQSATLAAQRLGGWLQGAVKTLKQVK